MVMTMMSKTSRHGERQDRSNAYLDVSDLTPTEEQLEVLDFLQKGSGNAFITGAAGSGKSAALSLYLRTNAHAAVVAPTGIAALQVGGSTIHSFFGMPLTPLKKGEVGEITRWTKERLRYLRVCIVDEVSMVRADMLDALDERLRFVKQRDLPFGGVRMIFVGDPYQLPPVVTEDDVEAITARYGSPEGWFFHSDVWKEDNPRKFVLKECHRQKGDNTFIDLLNRLRIGDVSVVHDINSLATLAKPDSDIPSLCTTNYEASNINAQEMLKLDEETQCFSTAEITGSFNINHVPVEEEIEFRKGARVMTVVNDGELYVNGSLGYVVDYDEGSGYPIVEFDSGESTTITPYIWEKRGSEVGSTKVLGTLEQLPLRHAWAITIHKSQGQSFDAARINLGSGAFAAGQTYVGLSRVRKLEGVHLSRELRESDVFIDEGVEAFIKQMS